jgi:hypothetical protein
VHDGVAVGVNVGVGVGGIVGAENVQLIMSMVL